MTKLRDDLVYRRPTSLVGAPVDVAMRVGDEGDDDANGVPFAGYACVYAFEYDVLGGPERGGWTEVVEPKAGALTLGRRPDVRLLYDHVGRPFARTNAGTLVLSEDDLGLACEAPGLDMSNPEVAATVSGLRRGDINEMSFAFRVTRQEWNDDYTYRRIIEYDLAVKGSDVSIVTYPANDATVAQVRAEARNGGRVELAAGNITAGLDARIARHQLDALREL